MKKFWRGLYIAAIYIVGAPLALIYLGVMIPVSLIKLNKDYGRVYAGEYFRGLWDGLKEGHDMLMFWVRYGEIDLYSYTMMKAKGSK